MRFVVFRCNAPGQEVRYDRFALAPSPGMSVLSALSAIRERYDESLAFRYSCRGAVCGTCAMLINKVPRLACRTQVKRLLEGRDTIHLDPYPAIAASAVPWDPEEEVLVEPLPHLPVIRDLIVDMTDFFAMYRLTGPVLRPAGPAPEKERVMTPQDAGQLETYTGCILCAACVAACPVNGENPGYWGPAALAKLYRFHIDPREAQDGSRLHAADHPSGWWACRFHTNCTRVCPKGVPPSVAIGRAEQELRKSREGSGHPPQ
jgi:succinate dehydrogenase / fumarate reductase iron-sulfur subunit